MVLFFELLVEGDSLREVLVAGVVVRRLSSELRGDAEEDHCRSSRALDRLGSRNEEDSGRVLDVLVASELNDSDSDSDCDSDSGSDSDCDSDSGCDSDAENDDDEAASDENDDENDEKDDGAASSGASELVGSEDDASASDSARYEETSGWDAEIEGAGALEI